MSKQDYLNSINEEGIDFIMILISSFKDKSGNVVENWQAKQLELFSKLTMK